MTVISLKGACDLHVHSYPCIFERLGDDVDIATKAKEAGMRAMVIKSHHESTCSRAYYVNRLVPDFQVFGGICLNYHVGGLNPTAVEAAIQMGAKIVWMPTFHTEDHKKYFGKIGGYSWQGNDTNIDLEPIKTLDEKGKIKRDVLTILEMCKEADIIFGTSHISPEEALIIAKNAKDMGYGKVIINHPFYRPPNLDLDIMGELLRLGAWMEFCSGTLSHIPGYGKIENYVEAIKRYGVSQIVIASDGGHPRKAWPSEDIRVFSQLLNLKGVALEDLNQMMCKNYDYLLNL